VLHLLIKNALAIPITKQLHHSVQRAPQKLLKKRNRTVLDGRPVCHTKCQGDDEMKSTWRSNISDCELDETAERRLM